MMKELLSIPPDVTIIAVTKTFPYRVVEEAYGAGFRHIGENRVEEAKEKIKESQKGGLTNIMWHMVGHVQSRKAREVASLFDWVDSADSINILQKLSKESQTLKKTLHVLLEVNVSGEESKFGFDLSGWTRKTEKLDRFIALLREASALPNIIMEGFMTMPPYVTHAEDNRQVFRGMKRLSEVIRAKIPFIGPHLSMGTSCDYPVAIEEGATQVRLGEALFGPRE